jgi:iron complex outermembrane receptor protein
VLTDVTDAVSIYANRSESFVPQFGTSSGGKPFKAEESVQHEIGTRFDIGGLQTNLAVFSIVKNNLATTDPDNPEFEVALGEVKSKGFEISVSGYLQSNWLFGAAYGYTDTEITRNFDDLQGNVLRNTPENTFSLQTRYDITGGALHGLGFGGTVEYVDDRFGNDSNTFKLPSHTRVDLGAYYAVNENIQVDLLVNNVLDEEIYLEGYNVVRVVREPGRTYLVRLKYRF